MKPFSEYFNTLQSDPGLSTFHRVHPDPLIGQSRSAVHGEKEGLQCQKKD